MTPNAHNLIWIDLEMTGLDPNQDLILEIATVITDDELNVLAEGPNLAIHQDQATLAKMDDWCTSQHTSSGLIDRVLASTVTAQQAEEETLAFIKQYVPERTSPMCGNTICQDRRFLYGYMPNLEKYFHYRNLDVSVLKMIAKSKYPHLIKGVRKQSKHQALSDVHDSIEEMRYYVANLLIPCHKP